MQNQSKKNFSSLILVIIAGILVFLVGFSIGRIDAENNSHPSYILGGDVKSSYDGVNVNTLWEVWDKIQAGYLKKDVDGDVLLDSAVKGLVEGLDDPYTNYLNAKETQDYLTSNAGEFEGIGTTLRYNGEYTEIETPIDGFPAAKAGLRPKDAILKVDDKDVAGKKAYEVAELIKGKAGTTTKLEIYRQGVKETLKFEIKREQIDMDSITYKKLDNGVVVIKINQFTESSLDEFEKQWDKVAKDVESKNPDKIIVDVRNNPGGYVDGVNYVLSDFFPKGTLLMSERDRDGNKSEKKAHKDGRFRNQKLVVLVNEGSASASEIFSGAIQDNKRGQIIGKPTVGKGVEQRIISLSNGGTLHLVFQEWLLPSGRNITKENSIKPDVEIDLTEENFQKGEDPQLNKAIEILK